MTVKPDVYNAPSYREKMSALNESRQAKRPMVHRVRPSGSPATTAAAGRSDGTILELAAAILSRNTREPSSVRSVRELDPKPASAIEHLRDRTLALVSDVFAALRAGDHAEDALTAVSSVLPWRRPVAATSAGHRASIPLRIENLEAEPVTVSLATGDLLDDEGRTIPCSAVSFDPSTVAIGAGRTVVVSANVAIPPQAIPGAYSGLVQAAGLSTVKAVITVDVC